MKTKELEARILQLEKELSELKSQMLSLALNRTQTIYVTPTAPIPYTPPYVSPYANPTITWWGSTTGGLATDVRCEISSLQRHQNLM
jgi:hypothetical protein